jgi:hypothetical protein
MVLLPMQAYIHSHSYYPQYPDGIISCTLPTTTRHSPFFLSPPPPPLPAALVLIPL